MRQSRFFVLLFVLPFLFVAIQQNALALSVNPASGLLNLTLEPGDTVSQEFTIKDLAPGDFDLTIVDFFYNENNARQFVAPGEYLANGMAEWTTLEPSGAITLGDDLKKTFTATINVPSDVEPGAYQGGILITKATPEDTAQIAITTRIAILMTANVGTEDLVESLEVENFELRDVQGKNEFRIDVLNTGNSFIIPMGTIKIYDNEGEQITNIQKVTRTVNGIETVSGFRDELPFNASRRSIPPDQSVAFNTEWSNIALPEGNYLAKLSGFYGKDSLELNAETEIVITKSLNIQTFGADDYGYRLPVYFSGEIANDGSKTVQVEPRIIITNLFGQRVEIINIAEDPIAISGGEVYAFSDAEWLQGGMLGPYTATLQVRHDGELVEEAISLYIIVWWQVALIILVLAIIIFAITKYVQMTKKLKSNTKKE